MVVTQCLLVFVLSTVVSCQCNGGIPSSEVQAILGYHNKLRSTISAGNYDVNGKKMPTAATTIPDLTWNCSLAESAQKAADTCKYSYSQYAVSNQIGENIDEKPSPEAVLTGVGAELSQKWETLFKTHGLSETRINRDMIRLMRQPIQMVWAATTSIGCGMKWCEARKKILFVCHYYPQGNIDGEHIYQPFSLCSNPLDASFVSKCDGGIAPEEVRGFLDVHNKLRSEISSGTFKIQNQLMPAARVPIPNLKWDCALEKSAQKKANQCVFEHDAGVTGESLGMEVGNSIVGIASTMSKKFMEEFDTFGWDNTKMTRATIEKMGHAAQMAWAKTTSFGCGLKKCDGDRLLVACHYDPPGNVIGEKVYEAV